MKPKSRKRGPVQPIIQGFGKRHSWFALDPKEHGVGGLVKHGIRSRKQDRRARSGEAYAVIFFPKIRGIGKAYIHMFGLDHSLSRTPEAAIVKFMDSMAKSESWQKMHNAGHRVRRVKITDMGDARMADTKNPRR